MSNQPPITVIVVTYNSADTIDKCLKSLLSQSLQPKEIIVVDNNSQDGTPGKIVSEYRGTSVRVIMNKDNLGFSEANNIGIRQSKGDFIALLNPDAKAENHWLENLHRRIISEEKIGIVGSKILKDNSNTIWSVGGKFSYFKPGMAFLIGTREEDKGQHDVATERYFIDTCACMVKKQVFDKPGLFDTKMFLNCEDLDHCHRARKEGYKIMYEPTAVVWHRIGHSMGRGELYFYHNIRGQLYFIKKNFRGFKKMFLLANYKIYLIYLRIKFRKKKDILKAIFCARFDAR